jgi:RimJ/RimL family protein N-acetyltransferase
MGARKVEFGWYLLPPYWGRGLAPAATALLLNWSFVDDRYEELYATCDPENLRSRRALEKAGLRLVRSDEEVNTWRGLRPRLRYSIAAADWHHRRVRPPSA